MTRHGQHQDTDAGSDGRDEVAGQDLPAVSTDHADKPVSKSESDRDSETAADAISDHAAQMIFDGD